MNPFDEEVHIGLLRSALALGDKALAEQARGAVELLLRLKPEEATALAMAYLVRDDLVNIGIVANDKSEKNFDAGS